MQVSLQLGQGSEQAVVAAMILDPKLVPYAVQKLEAEDFGCPRNRNLFRLVLELDSTCPGSADSVTVGQVIEERGSQDRYGNKDQLLDLLAGFPLNGYFEPHVDQVKKASRHRRAASIFDAHAQRFANGTLTGEQALLSCSREHLELLSRFEQSGPRRIGDIDREFRDQIEKLRNVERPPGIVSTPFGGLNAFMPCNGFGPGHLVIIAAGTGMGKTAFAQQLAENTAESGNVLFFALEMANEEVLKRYYARKAGNYGKRIGFAYGEAVDPVLQATKRASNDLHRSNLYLCDEPNLNMEMIRAHSLATHRNVGLKAVFIDYLQLVQPHQRDARQPRTVQVGGLTRSAKLLGKEIGCPVFLAAQLNRAPALREDPTPRLSDLRESGSIEQDADVVIMLHRPSVYKQDDPGPDQIFIQKNRHGETGVILAEFDGPTFSWIPKA